MEEGQVPAEKGGQELDLSTQGDWYIPFLQTNPHTPLGRGLSLQGQGHKGCLAFSLIPDTVIKA